MTHNERPDIQPYAIADHIAERRRGLAEALGASRVVPLGRRVSGPLDLLALRAEAERIRAFPGSLEATVHWLRERYEEAAMSRSLDAALKVAAVAIDELAAEKGEEW